MDEPGEIDRQPRTSQGRFHIHAERAVQEIPGAGKSSCWFHLIRWQEVKELL